MGTEPTHTAATGRILLTAAAAVGCLSLAVGIFLPRAGTPSPSIVIGGGTMLSLFIGTLGCRRILPALRPATRAVLKRLLVAFVVAPLSSLPIVRAIRVEGVPEGAGESLLILSFVVPSVPFLFALYPSPPQPSPPQARGGILRIALLTVASVYLGCAALFLWSLIWMVAGIVFDFPTSPR